MGRASILHEDVSLDSGRAHTRIEYGNSISTTAQDGVEIVFSSPFPAIPSIVIAAGQKEATWVKKATVSENGFTWASDNNNAAIGWIAIGEI